jgi:long-chain-fatty-acid--[acyl-carrier-protein] ligase
MVMQFFRVLYTFVLSRKYRVTIKGVELLQKEGGKLVMPNHQSSMDPQIIGVKFYKHAEIVPVVNESFFKIPFIGFFLKRWGAIAVAEFSKGNRDPKVMKTIFAGVNKALEEGKSVIIYPSGQLQYLGIEQVKNKQSVHVIVSNLPSNTKTRILGVRVSGLWGSTFSKAWTGNQPPFLPVFMKGIFFWFANLIFLSPKRKVTLEIVDITEEAIERAKGDRKSFNTYLEEFYNVNGIEEPTYIKHFFFFPRSKRKLPINIVKMYETMGKGSDAATLVRSKEK